MATLIIYALVFLAGAFVENKVGVINKIFKK